MKVAIFSTKYYERAYLNNANLENKHSLIYFDESLSAETINLATGFDAVCIMLLDKLDKEIIEKLSKMKVGDLLTLLFIELVWS